MSKSLVKKFLSDIPRSKFEDSLSEIEKFIISDSTKKVSENHIQVTLTHLHARYTLSVIFRDNWIMFGAEIMPDVAGRKIDEFHNFILRLNSELNGVKIAKIENKLFLIREEVADDCNYSTFKRNISIFHRVHEYVYPQLMRKAFELKLRFKS